MATNALVKERDVCTSMSHISILATFSLVIGSVFTAHLVAAEGESRKITFGVISDIHHGAVNDATIRMQGFVKAMQETRADFIVELGDLCRQKDDIDFLKVWRSFSGPSHIVLGNHDLDGGSTTSQMVAHLGMPAPYYTFIVAGMQGIVLNGNEPGGKAHGYPRFISRDQLAWLSDQLRATRHPSCIFIHQPFDSVGPNAIENASEVREVLEQAERTRPGSIIAVFAGHQHEDYARTIAGINYIEINSASYYWLQHKKNGGQVQYQDAIWGLATVDLKAGTLIITGRSSQWVGTDPWQRGADEAECPRERVRPAVSNRTFRFTVTKPE